MSNGQTATSSVRGAGYTVVFPFFVPQFAVAVSATLSWTGAPADLSLSLWYVRVNIEDCSITRFAAAMVQHRSRRRAYFKTRP
jgi:hypothetical protein